MRMSALVDRTMTDTRGTALCCPICGDCGIHVELATKLDSRAGLSAWDRDGDAAVIVMTCENDPTHVWGVVIGEHEGSATIQLVTLAELETRERRDGVYQAIANCGRNYAARYGRDDARPETTGRLELTD